MIHTPLLPLFGMLWIYEVVVILYMTLLLWWADLLGCVNWKVEGVGVAHCILWIELNFVPYQMTPSPLSWGSAGHKACASSLFKSFTYAVCGRCYIEFYITPYLVGGLSLLHIQSKFPQWDSLYPLVVADISLLCGWTTGPHWISIYVWWLRLGFPFSLKYWRAFLGLHDFIGVWWYFRAL